MRVNNGLLFVSLFFLTFLVVGCNNNSILLVNTNITNTIFNGSTTNITNNITTTINITNNISNNFYTNITNNFTNNISNNFYTNITNNITNNITITNNLTNNITKGMYGNSPYLFNDSSSISFNESKLNSTINSITYNKTYIDSITSSSTNLASNISNVTGINTGGNLQSILIENDGNTYNLSEVSGIPGFNVQINFTNVTQFNQIYFNIWYTDGSGHEVDIQLYNFNTSSWNTFGVLPGDTMLSVQTFGVGSDGFYINNSKVMLRIYHVSNGNPVHRLYIDYAVLKYSSSFVDLSNYYTINQYYSNATATFYSILNPNSFINLTAISVQNPLSYNASTGVINISKANATTNGYLNATDWSNFNSKASITTCSTNNVAIGTNTCTNNPTVNTLTTLSTILASGTIETDSYLVVSAPMSTNSTTGSNLMQIFSVSEGGVTDFMHTDRWGASDPAETVAFFPFGAFGSDSYAELDVGSFKTSNTDSSLGIHGHIGVNVRPNPLYTMLVNGNSFINDTLNISGIVSLSSQLNSVANINTSKNLSGDWSNAKTNYSNVQNVPPFITSVPYQSTAGGWSNTSAFTNTNLNVNTSNTITASNITLQSNCINGQVLKWVKGVGKCSNITASIPSISTLVTANVTTTAGDNLFILATGDVIVGATSIQMINLTFNGALEYTIDARGSATTNDYPFTLQAVKLNVGSGQQNISVVTGGSPTLQDVRISLIVMKP